MGQPYGDAHPHFQFLPQSADAVCRPRRDGWIPGPNNMSDDIAKYAPALEVYAKSLAETFGQKQIRFPLRPAGVHVGGRNRQAGDQRCKPHRV